VLRLGLETAVIKSDFAATLTDMRTSPVISQFPWMVKDLKLSPHGSGPLGWGISIEEVVNDEALTLDPKRHSRKYASLLADIKTQSNMSLTVICDVVPQGKSAAGTSFKKIDDVVYGYIDIDNISAGEYRVTPLRGWQLPARARHVAAPLDIFVGSIWSSVTKWCLIGKKPAPRLIVTNGCHRLRLKPGMEKYLLDLCVFLCSETYATQMRALARGSDGLAEIHENDLGQVLVPLIKSTAVRNELQPFVDGLLDGTSTLKGAVQEMLSASTLKMALPLARPHHSALV
jgi:type I restriction enzyme M protein